MRAPILTQKRAKSLRRTMTEPERALWHLLRRNRQGPHFRRQLNGQGIRVIRFAVEDVAVRSAWVVAAIAQAAAPSTA